MKLTTTARTLLAVLLLAFTGLSAQASSIDSFFAGDSGYNAGNHLTINGNTFTNTDSGWFRSDGIHNAGNTNYITGYCAPNDCGGYNFHGYLSFDLSNFSGGATTASFVVNSYLIQFDPGTLLLYGTSLMPSDVYSGNNYNSVALYNALVTGPLIGSLAVTPADSFTYLTVTLNSAGLAWLNAHAGTGAVIGMDFREANQVPEPASLLMLGTGLLSLGGFARKRLKKA